MTARSFAGASPPRAISDAARDARESSGVDHRRQRRVAVGREPQALQRRLALRRANAGPRRRRVEHDGRRQS